MPAEPPTKRAIAFIDGQNLFRCVKTAFGYTFPNYDVQALSEAVCARQGWQLTETRFQDQDISEVAEEIRAIARDQDRWLKIASAFPDSPTSTNRRGINSTDWIRIDRALYDSCLDSRDYRPRSTP